MPVYILHFSEPLSHAQHYVGFSTAPETRLQRHITRMEQPLIRAVLAAGITIKLARVFPGTDRNFERRLKNRKHTARYCPICNPAKVYRELKLK